LLALPLYLGVTFLVLFAWSRYVRTMSRVAALILLLLPLCFTGRALFTGRVYAPIDLPFMSEPLHAYRGDYGLGEPHNPSLSDLYQQIIPWKQAVRSAWAKGEWPLLNRYMLCGDVLAGSAQPAPYDPFELLSLLIPVAQALTFGAAITFFLAAFGAFAFARALDCREHAALFAAAAWMCSASIAFMVGWPLARSWALLPLVLFAVHLVVHEASLRSGVVLTSVLVLEILSGHPETLLHVVALGVSYGVFELIRTRSIRAVAIATISGILSLAITAVFLLPFLDAAPQSFQHAARVWFIGHPIETPPDVIARRARVMFFPWDADRYLEPDAGGAGFVVLALAIAALVLARRRRETWFFLTLAVLCVLAGINAPPIPQILHAIPLFDVAINQRFAFAADLFLVMLAAIALDAIPLNAQRIALALVLLERVFEAGGFYPSLPQRAFYPLVPTIAAIPKSDQPFRIAALHYHFIPDAAAFYDLEDARGYSAMNNFRLCDTFPLWSVPQSASFNIVVDASRPFLSFLNIRYLLTPLDSAPPSPQWKLIAQDKGGKLFENTAAAPRAFVPPIVWYRPKAKTVLAEMLEAEDFTERVWVEVPEYPWSNIVNGSGRVITHRAKLGYDLDATMQHAGWVIISETAWRGWRAYIDGRRVQYRIANHAFIGVHVPEGHHHVRLIFIPEAFTRGRAISFATLALLAISALTRAAIRARRRGSRRSS
jgi:Bacterial membrane protein YfhO